MISILCDAYHFEEQEVDEFFDKEYTMDIKGQIEQILDEVRKSNIPTESASTYITSILDYAKYDNFDYVKVQCAEVLKSMFTSFSKYMSIPVDEDYVVQQLNEFDKYTARYNRLKRSLQGAQTAAERTEVIWMNMFDFFMYLTVSNPYVKVLRIEDSTANS